MGDYKDWVKGQREKWIGRSVLYEGREYTVEDVDYNGLLLINKPAEFTETTAVGEWMVREIERSGDNVGSNCR